MVETHIGPSELHLKKELTALRKARFLRDPETCSSWRSPLTSRSFAATSSLNCGNGANGAVSRVNNSLGLFELPSRSDNKQKKVYLYNWRHHSSKSSDSGIKLDEGNMQGSECGSPESSLGDGPRLDPKSKAYLELPNNGLNVGAINPGSPLRAVRKSRRDVISRKRVTKHFVTPKLLGVPSSALGDSNSVEQSHDIDYCNSEDIRQLMDDLTQKSGYHSHSASPLLSGRMSKVLRNTRREDSSHSYTPASTSSYNRYGDREPSTVGSWDGNSVSFDGDEVDQLDLARRQGCGIPCYWSKRTKDRGCGGCYSPSLSDTIRRKGSSILCGGQKLYSTKKLFAYQKQKHLSKSSRGLPLLTNNRDRIGSSSGTASDELSNHFGEVDLEALSRLDGRRWSSCRSQEGLELALHGMADSEVPDQRSLSQKYRPRSFCELVGQSIVVQSLTNAIVRGRIAPAYLFQGPRGTGKTSTARIFAAALNCLSADESKPCGFCRGCSEYTGGNGSNVWEVDATNKEGLDRVRYMLRNMSAASTHSRYKVYIIDECHMLSSKMWSAFMKFLEEPPIRVVFIFITSDPESLPRGIVSRCQRYLFPKIKDTDIICRLRKISAEENLDVELDALDLIALNSDGSLRDAETMLDQLSLLGKRITTSLVNDLVGVVSDEKLLDLLEIAMSSDTVETVRRSRELMDSGVDPLALMSQLAGLIMDIIAGTFQLANSEGSGMGLGGRSLTEAELERLQQALKILSDAEKQLRRSSERSTWFTAALLQLGSGSNAEPTQSSSSSKHSVRKLNEDGATSERDFRCAASEKISEIWRRCIERCHSRALRQLLSDHGRLLSITESEGVLIAVIAFSESNILSRAEGFLSSITNSFEIVLSRNVEVIIGLLPENHMEGESLPDSPSSNYREKVDILDKERSDKSHFNSSKDGQKETPNFHNRSIDKKKSTLNMLQDEHSNSPLAVESSQLATLSTLSEGSHVLHGSKEKGKEIAIQMTDVAGVDEQRLESAWCQAAEKGPLGSVSHLRPEKNQVIPPNGLSDRNNDDSSIVAMSSNHWEDELTREIKALKAREACGHQMAKIGDDHYAISPSLLHRSSLAVNTDKESLGYDSGPGCNGLLCWNTRKPYRGKVRQGTYVRSQRMSRLSLFGQCGKAKTGQSRLRTK